MVTISLNPKRAVEKTLKKVYDNCNESEKIQMFLFMNDKSEYSEKDLPAFDEAIKQYPEEWNDVPLETIKTVRKWLAKYKILHQSYEGASNDVSIANS